MGKRKQYLINRLIARIRHVASPGSTQYVRLLQSRLTEYSTRFLRRWSQKLDALFDAWDKNIFYAQAFQKACRDVVAIAIMA